MSVDTQPTTRRARQRSGQRPFRPRGRRGWIVRRLLLVADVCALVVALAISRAGVVADVAPLDSGGTLFLALSLPGWVLLATLYGLYGKDASRAFYSTIDDLPGVLHLVIVGTCLTAGAEHVLAISEGTGLTAWVAFAVLAFALISLGRAAARTAVRMIPRLEENTVIVGASEVGQLIARKLALHPEYKLKLIGFVDSHPHEPISGAAEPVLLGAPADLPEIVRIHRVERVIIAFSSASHEDIIDLTRLMQTEVQIDVVPRLFENLSRRMTVSSIEGIPLLGVALPRLPLSALAIKRTTDLAFALPLLVVTAPFFALSALLIKLDSPGPVFFRQQRIGSGGPFRIFKFRTMQADAEARKHAVAHLNKHLVEGGDSRMFKVPDDPRVTRVGRFLRQTSLDELPQLLNVVAGHMSLVGPRPLIPEEDRYVEAWARRRLELKPGITGLWQVLGRDNIPFEEMLRLDYIYVTTWSFWQDIALLMQTIPIALRRRERAH